MRKYLLSLMMICAVCISAQEVTALSQQETATPTHRKVAEIVERGTILIGTTGDYRPLSFREEDGTYWGFDIEVAKEIANKLGVDIEFKKTSWPTLTADVLTEPQKFDLAIGGITITDARRETMLMSNGYLANGKTILCRASDVERYQSLADIDKPEVTVMVNPGGLNEKFANENLTHANIVVHQKNEEIPTLVAEGAADVMITEITEAPYYVQTDTRLAAPLLNTPFNHGEIGVLMQKGQEDLLQIVNATIHQMKADGSLRKLHEKYGLVYTFATDTLSTLRNQIDEIDCQLVDLLAKRMQISREIGQYKKVHSMGIVQSNRFNEILEKRCAQGTSLGIDTACVKSIFEAIHQESVNQQKEIFNK
jgi:cyclohexadienyl dehydratase